MSYILGMKIPRNKQRFLLQMHMLGRKRCLREFCLCSENVANYNPEALCDESVSVISEVHSAV